MATNKNATIRYRTLDKCFQNFGRDYYIEDLINNCNKSLLEVDPKSSGVSRRQIFDDIKFMKDSKGFEAPIITYKKGRKAYYRYETKDFSINNSPLNYTEAEQLKSAITILQRFEGAPQFEWINEITPMLSSKFNLDDINQKVMSYDSNIDYSGYDKIIPLFNAVVNKRVLDIEYVPYTKPPFKLEFHPYYLKQYNNRWFVFGLYKELGITPWNLALDRIKSINELSVDYIINDTDWEDYFYDVVGVTVPENSETKTIELLFTKEQSHYIRTKPLHPSQRNFEQESGELLVKLELLPNYELEVLILSFAEKVKVINPKFLKEKIFKRLNNASNLYE